MTPALLFLTLAAGSVSDADLLSRAEAEFARGVEWKGDGVLARPAFARSAAALDELWNRGHRNPILARNRGRARRLAGDLGGAIAALQEGLALARFDRPLQVDLEECRAAVAYPLDGELAGRCRPKPLRTIGTRLSPLDAYLVAGGLWLVLCAAVARFVMIRAGWWLVVASGAALALAALGAAWWHDESKREKERGRPLVVLREDAVLRKGNTDLHPPRIDQRLPRGVEARELGRRGGWVHVELADGTLGWLPAASLGEPGA